MNVSNLCRNSIFVGHGSSSWEDLIWTYSLLLTGTGLDKPFEILILDNPDVEFTWMNCPKLDEVFITVQLFRIRCIRGVYMTVIVYYD